MNDLRSASDDFAKRYEDAATRLFVDIESACAAAEDWPGGVRAAVIAALARLSEEPELGPLLLLEPYDAGLEAQIRHQETLGRLAELLRAGREEAGAEELPDIVEEGLVGAATFFVGRPVRRERADLLPALAPEITELLLRPYLGREQAERVAEGG